MLSLFMRGPTFSFCSCQTDSRVAATVVGDKEWALCTVRIYLDIRGETKLDESGRMLTSDAPSGWNEVAPEGCPEESSHSIVRCSPRGLPKGIEPVN